MSKCEEHVKYVDGKNLTAAHKKQNENRMTCGKCDNMNIDFENGIICKQHQMNMIKVLSESNANNVINNENMPCVIS